jgi:hypothetical protein
MTIVVHALRELLLDFLFMLLLILLVHFVVILLTVVLPTALVTTLLGAGAHTTVIALIARPTRNRFLLLLLIPLSIEFPRVILPVASSVSSDLAAPRAREMLLRKLASLAVPANHLQIVRLQVVHTRSLPTLSPTAATTTASTSSRQQVGCGIPQFFDNTQTESTILGVVGVARVRVLYASPVVLKDPFGPCPTSLLAQLPCERICIYLAIVVCHL